MISASSAATAAAAAASSSSSSTASVPGTTQRKRQRLDQLVGRIAHLVGSAPPGTVRSGRNTKSCLNKNNNCIIRSNNNNNNNEVVQGPERNSLSGDDEDDEEDESVIMAEPNSGGAAPGESPSPQQQSVITSLSRLRMRGGIRHLHPHSSTGQVFSFDHVHQQHVISDDEGEEEVFSPGLTTPSSFSSGHGGCPDRMTLSPCSQSSCTVDSPSGISFSPLSFTLDDDHHQASRITRSLTSDPSTPLNLSVSGRPAGITPPHASSSPRCSLLAAPSESEANGGRRRARSDSDLRDSQHHRTSIEGSVDDAAATAAQASWVLTPASSSSLNPSPPGQQQPQSGGSNGLHIAPRLSRLEHLRPPPLMVSLKRNSSDSTDSWPSPLFGQQESPVDLSVRSSAGSSVSSDSPNQMSNTSTASVSSSELSTSAYSSSAGLETPPLRFHNHLMTFGGGGSKSSSTSSSASSRRLKALTRSISLSHYLSTAECYSDLTAQLDGAVEQHHQHNPAGFGCEVCGQVFDLHDRLIKHMASRHKTGQQQQQQQPTRTSPAVSSGGDSSGVVVKGYQCEVCQRPFARSDMLTRHMRLHTGLKPYTCRICGQVFSRSDHLSTHQRTHTGEKPYRCPQCSYAACRRDMITRHLRTHTRSEDLDGIMADPR
nr:EOG090X0G73 [Chydorus sphaericus]